MSNVIATSLPPEFDLMTRMRHRLQSLAYASSLYRMMISGPVPKALEVVPTDPWPGDGSLGESIVDGKFAYAGQSFSAHPPQWLPEKANTAWLSYVHGFDWLRDLRSLGGDTARRVARSLMASWLDRFEQWSPYVWEPHLVALRLTHIIAMHDFVLASADAPFRARVFECLVRHHKHLLRLVPRAVAGFTAKQDDDDNQQLNNVSLPAAAQLQGIELIAVLRGLVFAGVALPDGDKALKLSLEIMPIALRHAFLADGSNAERNPSQQMHGLKCLVDIRHALKAGKIPQKISMPPELPIAIERAAGALRFYRHGDGALCLFHGSREENPVMLEALLTQADVRGRAPKTLIHGGYERLSLGRMLVFMDVGAPPLPGLDSYAHACLSSFECSIGRERLFVNCGAHPGLDHDAWYAAFAATAAHSTLTAQDKNNCEVLLAGGIGNRPLKIECVRKDTKEQQHVSLSHDSYLADHALMHTRSLTVLDDGEVMRGQDTINGADGKNIALRFHLHPLVQSSLIQNGKALLMKLPGGNGYRFRCENGHGEAQALCIEENLYYGKTIPRPAKQIVIRGTTGGGDSTWIWSLVREGRK